MKRFFSLLLMLPLLAFGAAGDYVDRSGTVTTGGTSQTLAAANPTRGAILITNPSTETEVLCINFTSVASCSTPGSILISPGGSYVARTGELITVVAATTGHKFTAKEGAIDALLVNPGSGSGGGGGDATAANQTTQITAEQAIQTNTSLTAPVTGVSVAAGDLSNMPFAVGKAAAQVIVHITANTATAGFFFSPDGAAAYGATPCALITNSGSSSIGVTTTTTTGIYACPVRGTHFKVTQTNAGGITAIAVPVAATTLTAMSVNVAAGSVGVTGTVAEDASVTGVGGVPQGFEARNSNKTAVSAAGDSVRGIAKLTGEQIVYPWSIPDATWQYASTADVTDTTSTEMVAAGGAGIRRYVNSCQFSNTDATVGTYVNVLSAATVIDVVYLAPQTASTAGQNSLPVHYAVPLRGAANEAINFQAVTTSAQLRVACQGITAAQ